MPLGAALKLPSGAVLPDYGAGGLYGLIGGVRRWLGGERDDLPWRPDGRAAPVLVFLLIDGLGDDFLQRHGAGSALLAHRRGRLTSVFPSTTASAVTMTMTGLSPAAHGLTGWFIDDRRFGGALAPLPLVRRGGGALRQPMLLPRLFPYRTLYQDARASCVVVSPRAIAHSRFSLRHARGARVVGYAGLDGLVEAVLAAAAELGAQGGGYVHAYYDRFDALSHEFGSRSARAVACFERVDAAFSSLLSGLRGLEADVVASADHGFTDNREERRLRLPDEVAAMLAGPLTGERRAAFCRVRAGAGGEFEAWARAELAGRGCVQRSAAVLRAGLFGPGPRHRRLEERVGTHALLMEPGWTIQDRVPGEAAHDMLGVHGGLSAEEMWVPLIAARTAG
ncbi:alkaline phosphatase family protein [Pseudothauera nasutitermitis]|uniref:Alkaline phosphatase family protein n=1 Tax=Pseudothauera nasutitermitis TaxID=2565930 RepID=A0A4S4B6G9_9RHOO|nr:alkaline phosphatase family protein [Pseudothauera nasutitermitis]THF67426.1 alkaline phosphatase family protein [Pseudothauera nasutitermitis]